MSMREQELFYLEELYKYRRDEQEYQDVLQELSKKEDELDRQIRNAPYDRLPTDNRSKLDRWREMRIAEQTKVNKRNAILIGVLGVFTVLLWLPAIIVAVWLHKNAEERATRKVVSETATEYRDAYEKDKEAAEENERRRVPAQEAMKDKLQPDYAALEERTYEAIRGKTKLWQSVCTNPLCTTLQNESIEDIAFLIQKMRSGRADSLKEALLLLDQQHVVDEKTARELQWRREDLEIHAAERAEDVQRAEDAEREAERRQRSIENELYKTRRVIQIYGKE